MIKAKKSLGQNFLTDPKALASIVAAADLSVADRVLEIGSGTGILTNELVKKAGKVLAVEKDERLAALVYSQFQMANFQNKPQFPTIKENLKMITGDILEINLPKVIEENGFQDYKVVANIPYYITGRIIRLLLETKYRPKELVLLVQKEVAERICAQPGQMSILAVSVQFYGQPKLMGIVPRTSFNPAPEVDSAILKITLPVRAEMFEDGDLFGSAKTKNFFQIVRIGFSSKRKTLLNNLAAGLKKNKSELEGIFAKLSWNLNVRAQELSIDDWKALEMLL